MFLSYAMRKAFQTSVLLSFVMAVAAGCGGGEDESLTPPMPPVSPGGSGNGDGGNGGGGEPDYKSFLIPSADLSRVVRTFSEMDGRGRTQYFNPENAVASSVIVSSGLEPESRLQGGNSSGDMVDARLSGDGLGNLSILLDRVGLGSVDGKDLDLSWGPLSRSASSDSYGTSAFLHRWDSSGVHRADGDGRWRMVAAGWQSAADYGDWAVMGFYLVDEGYRDLSDDTIQVGSFVASPELREGVFSYPVGDARYEGPTLGMMVQEYGSARNQPEGTIAEAGYKGQVTLDVSFESGSRGVRPVLKASSFHGLSTIAEGRLMLPDGRRLSLPAGTSLRAGAGPGRYVFSAEMDAVGHPRLVGGSYNVKDTTAWDDGTVTYLMGSYLAATEASGLQGALNALVGN